MALSNTLYNAIFKRNFTMLTFVFGAGFAINFGYAKTMDNIWDKWNQGRQWKDIRHKYVEAADDEE